MTVDLQRTSALSSKTTGVQELLRTLVGFDTSMPADYKPGQPMVHLHHPEKSGG